MNVIDLSRRLSPRALRRFVNRYRKQLLGGGSLAVIAASSILLAVPALAHDGTATPLPDCSSTLPLKTPCAAPVIPTPAAGVSDYSVTLPGVGTLNITIDPATNQVSAASVASVDAAFTASAVKVDGDGDKVTVTLTSVTDPTQVYKVTVKVKPPATAGGAPIITAKVKARHTETKELGEHQSDSDHGTGDHTLSFGGFGDHD
jgi:hypothetical protein